jgi:hypothetical protein
MNSDRIRAALEVVNWLGERAGCLPEERSCAYQMQVTLAITGLYLAEYAVHQDRGQDAYDALLGTVRGDLDVPEAAQLWSAFGQLAG